MLINDKLVGHLEGELEDNNIIFTLALKIFFKIDEATIYYLIIFFVNVQG